MHRIRRHLGITVVRGEGVYLVCEHGSAVVTDPFAERLFPLLDGKHDVDQIATALDLPVDHVRAVIEQLIRAGQVVDVDPEADERACGYWESLNLQGDDAVRDAETGIRLTLFGDVPDTGLHLPEGDFHVVLTDDYLRPELADFADDMHAAGTPWLLAKPVGVVGYVGPVFTPDGPCFRCLEVRFRGHRRAEDYLETRLPGTHVAPPVVDIPATRQLVLGAIATRAAHWLAGHRPNPGELLAIDTATLRTRSHIVAKRPQCPVCGDPRIVAAAMTKPIEISTRRKEFSTDGGHRSRTPADMIATWSHLVDPITGIVPALTPIATGMPFVHGYASGYNRALRVSSLRGLREGLRVHSAGKGATDVQAKASALGEALERYSGVYAGDEPKIRARFHDLDNAIHPNDSMLFSERQFEHRRQTNAERIMFQMVADPLDERAEIDWTPMWSLLDQTRRYVPTGLLFFSYPFRKDIYAIADSNGCAAGTSVEDATLQGFYELVERDAVAVWWYNRLRVPGFDLDSLREPWVDIVRAEYMNLGRELWALDVTSDFGIPAVVAVSRRVDKAEEDIIVGFGAHHDARIAGLRAVSELNQFLPHVATITEAGYQRADANQRDWWQHATVADHPYLLPDPNQPASSTVGLSLPTGDDLADDLRCCLELVRAKGMDLLAIDMTRPDIGLPVVKVMVPGMRHFWNRYAPGRLYDVPVAQGRLARPHTEDQLNPTVMFV